MTAPMSPSEWAELARQRSYVSDSGCWHWLGVTVRGVPVFQMARKRYRVTRMAAGLKPGRYVEMTCCNIDCVNPAHIRAVTRSYYVRRDCANRRKLTFVQMRQARKRSGLCKLDEVKAAEIRRQWAEGISLRKIARPLGVSAQTVHNVILGRAWRVASPWAI